MRAVVTGSTGLVGSHIVRALVAAGWAVRALARPSSDTSVIDHLPIDIRRGDVRDATSLVDLARDCDLVFHAAATFDYRQPRVELEQTAVSGTEHVLRASREAGARRVVLTSSSVVLGYSESPRVTSSSGGPVSATDDNPYVASKVLQELVAIDTAKELGLELLLVCPTLTVGPFDARLGASCCSSVRR